MMGISLQHKDIFILTFLMIIIKIKNIQYYFIFMGMGIQDMYKNMLIKEENKELFLFSHKACMMIHKIKQIPWDKNDYSICTSTTES